MATKKKLPKSLNWEQEARKVSVGTPEDWNALIDTLDWEKYILFEATEGVRTSRVFWMEGRWSYVWKGDNHVVIYIGFTQEHHEMWYFNEDNGQGIKGFSALKALTSRMQETNGKKLQARFGALNEFDKDNYWMIQGLHDINRCVGPFVGNASVKKNQYYPDKVYKADVSSAYPSEGIYRLPDLRTAEQVDYYVEPTEEWPIVFYMQHHHIAEYGRFDTHKDQMHPLYTNYRGNGKRRVRKTTWKKEEAITFTDKYLDIPEDCIRCKYSEYTLEEFLYFYEKKSDPNATDEEKALAKAVMNLAIGTFDFVEASAGSVERSKHTYFGHLRAIICARHNHKMIEYYDEIVKNGYEVLQVQTDAIMWRGGPIESATRDKALGKLHLEIEDGRAYIHGCGAYWIEDDNTHIEKHQGIRNFPKDKVNSLEDFKEFFETDNIVYEDWVLNEETLKYELREV